MEQKREIKKAKSKALNKKSDPNINTMKSKKPISDPKATLSQGFIQRDMPQQGFCYKYMPLTGIVSPPNRCKACRQKKKHFGAYRGPEDSRRNPVETIRMEGQLDPLALVQEMQRQMQAMQAEISTLRAECAVG
ncbi:hypothetical protein VIGAN_06030300 [Vigna angularis var. angularis]|uniref:Uncharacterized protein n=1 Tax=Vigna angularis var. angularis TaxID=157739 RepID=A0A0S3S940_PHAAN|nr:hypothetical protein VIGAN_06030300 [Vigna angularis var. angularis]